VTERQEASGTKRDAVDDVRKKKNRLEDVAGKMCRWMS